MADEYGTAFDATTVRGLQDGTLDGYLRQLRRLARLERMRPGDGARGILEARLMQVVQGDLSESAAKIVLAAARLAEKMEWLAPVVRKSDWYLVMSIEQRRCKEQRAEAKEWAQLEDLCRLCAAASSFAEWEAVALACVSVGHCLRGSEAGGGVGQEDEGVRFFGTKSRRGVQRQEVGPWVREWLQFLAKLRALKGFHPDRGAWHESREALGKTLVSLLERGEGKKTVRWHSFRRMGAAQLRKMGAPLTTIMLWGGVEVSESRADVYRGPPQVEVCPLGKNPMAHVGGGGQSQATAQSRAPHSLSGRHGYAGKSPSRPGKLPDLLGDRLRGVRMHANEEGQCPRVRVLRGQLRDAARAISEMRGVKVHRQEMVRNLITGMGEAVLRLECGEEGLDTLCSVLTKVGEGDLEYYSSSDEEGVVTEEMAARGVGEAGCVTVSDKIWNSLVPRDLLGVYRRQLREDSAGVEKSQGGRPGPVDAMLESLRTETKGLRRTKRPETAKMFLTWKNALKCRAILDARGVNASDPRKPPKFRLPGLEAIRHWMGRARPRRVGGGRCRVFLAKLDLQNAYWSIRLPTAWRSVFVVGGRSGRRFRYARLPFGWAYSPVICQKLVSSVIRGALSRRGVRGWVYLDDILLSCRSKSRLRGAVRDCIRRLRRAGFIVGAKSEPEPTERLGFIGKQIDTKAGTISNAVGALVGAFRAWVRGVGRGRLPSKVMERLLGKMCWLSRPNAGLGAFLAGAYRGLQSGKGVFGRGVCKGVATVLLFSCVPQRCDPPGPGGRGAWEVFVDAAPEGKVFRLGIVGGGGYYRSEVCPP